MSDNDKRTDGTKPVIGSAERARTDRLQRWFPTFVVLQHVCRCARPFGIAVLCFGLTLYLTFDIYASVRLNRDLAAIRRHGDPLTLTEMTPPPIPDSQNAALLYLSAHDSLEPIVARKVASLGLNPHPQKLTQAELAQSEAAIRLVRRATELPLCRFPFPGKDQWDNFLWDDGVKLSTLANLMVQVAVDEGRKGETAQSLADINSIFVMSRRLGAGPTAMPFSESLQIASIGYAALACVLEDEPSAAAMAGPWLAELPADTWVAPSYMRVVAGERAFWIQWGEYQRTYARTVGRPLLTPLAVVDDPFIKWDEIHNLGRPYPNEFGLATMVENSLMYRQLAEVAIALAAYRAAHGRYPARLSDAATLGVDLRLFHPSSGMSFTYRLHGRSYWLSERPNNRHLVYKAGVPICASWLNCFAEAW